MIPTHRMRKRVAALAAAAAVLGSVAISTGIADAAATSPAGPATVTPPTGTSDSNFDLGIPSGATCPGDSAAGWLWSAIVVPRTADIGTLKFSASGVVQAPAGQPATLYRSLRIGGANLTQEPPNLVDGLINPSRLDVVNLSGAVLTPGAYSVAVACYNVQSTSTSFLETGKYYSGPITVVASAGAGVNNFTYAVGDPQVAPVLSLGAGTGIAQTINITNAQTGLTSYTLNVTPAPSDALPTVATSATSFSLTGLSLGTSYSVTLTANKTGFMPQLSALPFTASANFPITPTALSVFEGDALVVNWAAPAGPTPLSYTVVVAGGAVNESQSIPAATVPLRATFAGTIPGTPPLNRFPAGAYTVTVTGVYASGAGAASSGTTQVNSNPGALVFQELTVTRPKGALILTQRCGVSNALAPVSTTAAVGAVSVPNGFPGFPFDLSGEAVNGRVGSSPFLVDANNNFVDGPDADTAIGPDVDPEFGNYPLPNVSATNAVSPFGNITQCGLSMGTAKFVTEFNSPAFGGAAGFVSPLAGEFFAANGRLNEVTVLDTRDLDTGWKLRGDIESRFTSLSNGDSFSGNYLGWIPAMTDDSDVVGGEGPNGTGPLYDQRVIAGLQSPLTQRANGVVLPGDGFPVGNGHDTAPNATGMTDNPVLASAAPNSGLGIATLDARLLLLIPASVDAADYSATLTLTVAP